jgi:hypothetical protein
MASTYSTSLRLELIGQGEQSGTWGITTNNNFGSLVEQAITGVQTISMSNATYTLTNYDGAVDEARNAVLVVSGTNLAPQNLIAPGVEKVYIVSNTSGSNVTIKTSGGNGIAVANGSTSLVYCDGTNFFSATPNINSISGNLAVSGNETVGGALAVGGNLNVTGSITAGSFTGITGRILQSVVSSTTSSSSTNAAFNVLAATSHSATITPTSSTSKILVLLSSSQYVYGGGSPTIGVLTIFRNSTNLAGAGTTKFMTETGYSSTGDTGQIGISLLDSPATTSSTTYTAYQGVTGGGNVEYNPALFATFVLLEISA